MAPQADGVIANASGAAVRADLNNQLAALFTNHSGATQPATTYPYQWWADTTAGQLKLRNAANDGWVTIQELDGTMLMEDGTAAAPGLAFASDLDTGFYRGAANELGIATGGTNAVYIDDAQNVGIGSTNPGSYSYSDLVVTGATGGMSIVTGTSDTGSLVFADGVTGVGAFRGAVQYNHSVDSLIFAANGGEKARIDSSGRLLVGTSTSPSTGSGQYALLTVQGFQGTPTGAAFVSLQRGEAASSITTDEALGLINFGDSSGNSFAEITCRADANAGAGDYPGRLAFSTTADGASSPTERMIIRQDGTTQIFAVYTATTGAAANVNVDANGYLTRSTSSIKYKTSVETLEDQYADALLQCRPVWYRSLSEKDNPEWGWWGFIAEEVAEIDPRLVHWKTQEVTFDETGSAVTTDLETPEPEGVQYDRFVPHLLNLIKRQGEAITELQAEVAALKAQ